MPAISPVKMGITAMSLDATPPQPFADGTSAQLLRGGCGSRLPRSACLRLEEQDIGDLPYHPHADPGEMWATRRMALKLGGHSACACAWAGPIGIHLRQSDQGHPMALLEPEGSAPESAPRFASSPPATPIQRTITSTCSARAWAAWRAAIVPRSSDPAILIFRAMNTRKAVGGADFEPPRKRPDDRLRGASGYVRRFREAFALECAALKAWRETWASAIDPIVRSVENAEEGDRWLGPKMARQASAGRERVSQVYVVQLPSNVIEAGAFA